jgi:tetratricopeptide (TPR) repeat protein
MRRFVAPVLLALAACLTVPPPHPRALECNELCAQYIGAGDLTNAEVQCDLGLQFSPQYADLWVNKGLISLRRGQEDKAKENFIKALRYNQEQAQAYNNLGYIYYKNQEYGKAHDNFQRALKVNPDYLEARYNLALAYKDLGKRDEAKKEFRTILGTPHGAALADPHHWLGVLALEDGANDEAIEHLHKSVELDPSYGDAWMNLGNAYMEGGRFQEAVEAFTSCIEADPKNAPCRNNVTIARRKTALLDPTLKEVKEDASGEGSPNKFFQLAKNYREKGLKDEERRAYIKCVKADQKFAPCHFGLYELYHDDHRDKEAKIACQNFLKFATQDEYPQEFASCEKYVAASQY